MDSLFLDPSQCKPCITCGKPKPLADFHEYRNTLKDGAMQVGVRLTCIECVNLHRRTRHAHEKSGAEAPLESSIIDIAPYKRRLTAKEFLPFEEARALVRAAGLANAAEWCSYCISGLKPPNIPSNPNHIYKSQWKSFGDWLGTNRVSNRKLEFLPYEEARAFAHTLKLKTRKEWQAYGKEQKRPSNIPSDPNRTYAGQFQGWGDWLGTGVKAPYDREYRPFEESRTFVRALKLKNQSAWYSYCVSGNKPSDIPSHPNSVYGEEFLGYGDWLGTGNFAKFDQRYIPVMSEHDRKKARTISHRRRSRKKAVLGSHTFVQIQEQLKRQKYRCYYAACGFAKFKKRNREYIYHVEHTFPLSRVAGTDIPANDMSYIVLACPSCNDKKGNKFPWEWAAGGRLL